MGPFTLLTLGLLASGSDEPPKPAPPPAEVKAERRTDLNLLGATDTQSGESRRNENVQFNLIDNNALKELNLRMGTTATIVTEFRPDRNYFGGEFGNIPPAPLHVDGSKVNGFHGSAWISHNNSIFSARSFFQAGGVQPARENSYGFGSGGALWKGAFTSLDANQQKLRGNVNGNVIVPLAIERTPLSTDPEIRRIVGRFLSAYPVFLPNRTDIDPRALNINAPQRIDTNGLTARIDQTLGDRSRLTFRHGWTAQQVDAFQLVAGQNPDTTTRSHNARITWSRAVSASTTWEISAGLDRTHSLLAPEPNAVGPSVTIGTVIAPLGPGSGIPIDRTQNRFRYAVQVRHTHGNHTLTAGYEIARLRFNGRETSSNRGVLYFRNDFGRDAMTNFRLGIPSRFSTGIGELHRGFRMWQQQIHIGDSWRVSSRLTVNGSIRYQPVTGPVEVNGLTQVPLQCDCNNFGPRLGLAYRLPGSWGVLRTAYAIEFGDMFPVTLNQVRWNPPNFQKIEVQGPDLIDPLKNADRNPNGRSTFFELPPNLVSPYSRHYNASWEVASRRYVKLQFGYVGSRTNKLFMLWHTNRAAVVPGIPLTTATINDRRPNTQSFEIRRIQNASRAYFDAGRISVIVPEFHGLSVDTSYWWSKAIDLGAAYTNTAAGDDARQGLSQSEYLVASDLRGPSTFDQAHSFLLRAAYGTPRLTRPALDHAFGQWKLSVVQLAKTGAPFTVISGSDAPGFGNVDGANGDRPNLVDPSILGRKISHPDTSRVLLPRSAFRFISPGETRGSLGFNTFRRGGLRNVNAALSRTWAIAAEKTVTFRAESINFLNTPQFAEPNTDLTSPAFGQITNTLNDGRAFQFLLRFGW